MIDATVMFIINLFLDISFALNSILLKLPRILESSIKISHELKGNGPKRSLSCLRLLNFVALDNWSPCFYLYREWMDFQSCKIRQEYKSKISLNNTDLINKLNKHINIIKVSLKHLPLKEPYYGLVLNIIAKVICKIYWYKITTVFIAHRKN